MKVHITATYRVPGNTDAVKAVESELIANPDFYVALNKSLNQGVDDLKQTNTDGTMTREVVIQPDYREVPAVARPFVSRDALSYHEKTTYDFSTHRGQVTITPLSASLRSKVKSSAGIQLRGGGATAPRTVYHDYNTNIDVNVFLVGGTIERAMADQLRAKASRIEAFGQKWLNEHLASGTANSDTDAAA